MSLFGLLTGAWVSPNNPITKKSYLSIDDDFPMDAERAFPSQLTSHTLYLLELSKTMSNQGRITYSQEEECWRERELLESQVRV